jgi:phage/plasmid-like protein (TIGR03299 family)
MAHLIESMAYVGDTPWHGLGSELSPKQPLEVWAREAGMDWRIESSDVNFMAENDRGHNLILPFAEQKVLYRSDTLEPLSVVSQRYQEVQPSEILEFYRDLTEHADFELETAGVLKGGRKFWALARTGQSATLRGGDVSHGYLLLATACDGTLATTAQFTNIRVVCNNTLAISLADGSGGVVKVPHSTTFDADKVKQQLGVSVSQWDDFNYEMKQLTNRRVTQAEAANYLNRVFNDVKDDGLILFNTAKKEKDAVPNAKAMNQVMKMFNGQGRGADLDAAKDTAYGLLCSITEYVDHERRAMSRDHRLDGAWFGSGAKLKQKGLEESLLMLA